MENYRIDELVDVEQLRQLLDAHSRVSGMACGLTDGKGIHLVTAGWQDLCSQFHLVHPVTCARCKENAASINAELQGSPSDIIERCCHSNMVDIAMPIIFDGRHQATLITGQFFYEDNPPDRDFFIGQAETLCFDKGEYLTALDAVPVFSREHVRSNLLLLRHIVQVLGESGLKNLRLAQETKERLQAEETAWESEAKYRRFVETSNEGVWEVDRHRRTTFVNARMAEMMGYSREEMIGRLLDDFIYEGEGVDYQARMAARRQGASEHFERRFRRKDGSVLWSWVSATAIKDKDGNFQGAFAMQTDITERKQAEYRAALMSFGLNCVHEAAFLIDKHARFHFANEEACRILGYSREELLSMGVADIDPDFPAERWLDHWHKLKQCKSIMFEGRHKTKEGRIIPVEINGNFFEYDGEQFSLSLVRDISERKRAEKELLASEQLFRALVENSPDHVVRYDLDCRRTYVNPALQKAFAGAANPALGKSPMDQSPIQGAHAYTDRLRQVIETGKEHAQEMQFRTAEGEMRWGHVRLTPEFDADGNVASVMAIARDIHEIKESEQRILRFAASLPGAFFYTFKRTVDGRYCFPYASPGIKELYGLEPEDVREDMTPLHMLAHPEDRLRIEARIAESFKTLEPFQVEVRVCRADRPQIWVEARSIPVRDPDGSILWHGIMLDVTEQKQMERMLRKREQEFRTLAENSPDPVVRYDTECRRIYVNPAWTRVNGICAEDALGKSPVEKAMVIAPSANDFQDRLKNEVITYGQHVEMEIQSKDGDGNPRTLALYAVPEFDEEGKVVSALTVARDVSQLHKVEEQLRQSQKMEAIGTLVGGIAHDFNNKLASINANLYMAKRSIGGNEEAAQRLDTVEILSFEAADMIRQLLTFARKGKIEQVPLKLADFIKEVTKLNRIAIPENIRLTVNYGKHPLPVVGDATQLQQAFLNLLTNARDALQEAADPHIDVSLSLYKPDRDFRSQHPEAGDIQSYACIQVQDNGKGIDPEHVDQVFEPFFTTKEVGKGTGLGLAIVYGVVKAHHGIIDVESALGRGTRFSMYLPVQAAAPVGTPPAREDIAEGHGESILIADDDTHVLEAFAEVLESINYRVLKARNGHEAISLFREHADEIDLVLLDIVMPKMKGPEAARCIREIRPDVKLLLATGYDSQEESESMGNEIEVLDKPYAIGRASRMIRKLLDGSC